MENTFDVRTKFGAYWDCRLYTSTYDVNGGLYIGVVSDSGNGMEPVMDITVNVGTLAPKGCIAVKNHSENAGVLDEMKRIGLVTAVIGSVQSGFVKIPICRYNAETLERYRYRG